jgi:uncharacterized ParB-like nuclease family protein
MADPLDILNTHNKGDKEFYNLNLSCCKLKAVDEAGGQAVCPSLHGSNAEQLCQRQRHLKCDVFRKRRFERATKSSRPGLVQR